MLDKLKTALVLIVISALAGALIWGTNLATEQQIIDNRIAREEGYYKEIFGLDADAFITFVKTDLDGPVIVQEVVIYDVNEELVGVIYKGDDKNTYGDVSVLVGLDIASETISKVVISNTTNTPTFVKGLEKERKEEPSYLDNFTDQSINDYTIDEKTGASYTYGSVTLIVEEATTLFQESWGE